MTPDNRPATPALDFLAFIQGRAETPGYQDMLDERDETRISQILTDMDERRARSQLLRMQARLTDRAFLEPADLARLEAITGPAQEPRLRLGLRFRKEYDRVILLVLAVLAVLLTVVFVIIVPVVRHNDSGGAPPPAVGPQNQQQGQVPAPAYSDLSLFKRDWGPFRQLTPSDAAPQTGAPALLLLQSGGYYVTRWVVSPADPGWSQDITGDVGTVNVNGDYIDLTDSSGNPWIVRVDQPFVFSTDPAVVLRIDATGTVYQMSQAHATAVRSHLK